ncbi:hypothetical protein [Vibrio genomosp. F10]|nr:hypothetical protein [Vibrio genomosp. F10]
MKLVRKAVQEPIEHIHSELQSQQDVTFGLVKTTLQHHFEPAITFEYAA